MYFFLLGLIVAAYFFVELLQNGAGILWYLFVISFCVVVLLS